MYAFISPARRTANSTGPMAIPLATFLLLTWTLLPAATANAQALPVTHTIRNNALNPSNYAYFQNTLRPWTDRNMPMITTFIRNRILCGHTKTHTEVILEVEDSLPPPKDRAYVSDNTIKVSLDFIRGPLFANETVRVAYFKRTMYHEMTHVWQFLAGYTYGGKTWALVEGIADYTAIKAGYLQLGSCCPREPTWYDRAYCDAAHFLLYLESAGYRGVVCNVNLMLMNGYDDQSFVSILHNNSPDVLWQTYLQTLICFSSTATTTTQMRADAHLLLQHCHNNHTDVATY